MFFETLFRSQIWAVEPGYATRMMPVVTNLLKGNKIDFPGGNGEKQKPLYAAITDDPNNFDMGDAIVSESIGIVYIVGPMFKRAEGFDRMCGAAGTGRVLEQVNAMAEDSRIRGIVLNIDSPGGSVDGTFELWRGIRAAAEKKPVIAYVDGWACSAAYWVASAASHIMLSSETAMVGSVGGVVSHMSLEAWYAQNGVNVNYITNPEATEKMLFRENEDIDETRKQRIVETILTPAVKVFHEAVLSGRKDIDTDEVFTGRLFTGKEGIAAGLADSIGTLDEAIGIASESNQGGMSAATTINSNEEDDMKKLLAQMQALLASHKVSAESEEPAEEVVETPESEERPATEAPAEEAAQQQENEETASEEEAAALEALTALQARMDAMETRLAAVTTERDGLARDLAALKSGRPDTAAEKNRPLNASAGKGGETNMYATALKNNGFKKS